jgi:hypothetical protein
LTDEEQMANISISKSDENTATSFQIQLPGEGLEAVVLRENVLITIIAKGTTSLLIFVDAEGCKGGKARFAQLKVEVKGEVSHYPIFLQVDPSNPDS